MFLSTSFLICTASYCPEMLASASCLYAMKLSILKKKKKKHFPYTLSNHKNNEKRLTFTISFTSMASKESSTLTSPLDCNKFASNLSMWPDSIWENLKALMLHSLKIQQVDTFTLELKFPKSQVSPHQDSQSFKA